MKRIGLYFIGIVLLVSCGRKQSQIERFYENGVEVVLNHAQPYRAKGEPINLVLQEEFVIDFEKKDIAALGLTDVWGFDVDSEGNIFIFQSPISQGDLVFRFDPKGHYVSSFARRGQGPGEVERPLFQKINDRDELPITEPGLSKVMWFDKNGNIANEIRMGISVGFMGSMVYPLKNGHYLIRRSLRGELEGTLDFVLSLFDSQFNEILELDRFEVIQPIKAERFRLPMHASIWCVSKDHVYVAEEKHGYEIRVYDLEGHLERKIRKEHQSVKVPGEFKRSLGERLEHTPSAVKDKIYFPDHFPAFQSIVTDDKGHLFVMTFERGKNPKEFVFDIFNQAGLFIGTASIDAHLNDPFFTPGAPLDAWISIKKDHFYALRMKPSGYLELAVYKTMWQ